MQQITTDPVTLFIVIASAIVVGSIGTILTQAILKYIYWKKVAVRKHPTNRKDGFRLPKKTFDFEEEDGNELN